MHNIIRILQRRTETLDRFDLSYDVSRRGPKVCVRRCEKYVNSCVRSVDLLQICVFYRVSDEVEVLQAILMDDLVIKSVEDAPYLIETVVRPSTADDIDQQYVCVTLEVKLTPGYPDSSPEVTLRNPRGLDDRILAALNLQIKEKLADRVGVAVIYELIEVSSYS